MSAKGHNRPRLRLVSDEWGRGTIFGGVRVVAAPESQPPFRVDAWAEEEDTHLLLSAEPVLREPRESLAELVAAAEVARAATPGSVVVRARRPLRLLAVVHDIDRQPTWREAWIASALDGILRVARDRRLGAIALPLIGTRHGTLAPVRFGELLRRSLERAPASHPRRLWLVAPPERSAPVLRILRTDRLPRR